MGKGLGVGGGVHPALDVGLGAHLTVEGVLSLVGSEVEFRSLQEAVAEAVAVAEAEASTSAFSTN